MGTVRRFFARGFIVGRDAFYSRSYVNSLQFQTVIYVDGTRLVCVSCIEERLNKEVGAPIPGEHSSGPIPAVRCWSKPNYENRSRDIPETRNGSAPVVTTQKPFFFARATDSRYSTSRGQSRQSTTSLFKSMICRFARFEVALTISPFMRASSLILLDGLLLD